MVRRFNPGRARYRRFPEGNLNETVRLPWGETCDRFLSMPEFCTKFGVHRNTVRWYMAKKRIIAMKSGYRWFIDMKESDIPKSYAPSAPESLHSRLKGRRRELKHLGRRKRYVIDFNQEAHVFTGYADIYETLGDILGVEDGSQSSLKLRKPCWNAFQLRLNLENGKRVFVLCNPGKAHTAMKEVIGKQVRGSTVVEAWQPRKYRYK